MSEATTLPIEPPQQLPNLPFLQIEMKLNVTFGRTYYLVKV